MKRFLKFATLPVFAFALSVAHASTITSAVVYEGIPSPDNSADPANWASSLPSASFTIGVLGINFMSPPADYTVASFLNNPTFSNQVNGFDPNAVADNLELVITGTVTLHAGVNVFDVAHDDGVELNIAGLGNVVDSPGPSDLWISPFLVDVPADGDYAFTLQYSECCGAPAGLIWTIDDASVGAVPEPASLTLFGSGMVGLYGLARRRFAKVS